MSELQTLIAEEIVQPVDERVASFAAAIAAEYGEASRAILFYGSCLRTANIDGLMLDFYLIVSDYEVSYREKWLVHANKLLPPNVFPASYDNLVAKVAILSEADFDRLNRVDASAVSVWARFSQPTRLVWYADLQAKQKVIAAIENAPLTLFELTVPLMPKNKRDNILAIWERGFKLTYRSELRAERSGRPGSVVSADRERYRRFGTAARTALARAHQAGGGLSRAMAKKKWRQLRFNGKLLTIARLIKASATFAGGLDYLAWKINRHAGTDYVVRPWQRKWPILGGLAMLPRMIAVGAVK